MSTLSRATYKTTYSDSAGQFPTNTTRQITATRVRTFADDTIDSIVTKNDDYDYWFKKTTASGTDTYTITDTVPPGYASDEKWLISFTNSNTGASTLNRNSLGAKGLKSATGGALGAGDIVAGGYYLVIYNGTEYRILNSVAAAGSVSGLTTPRIPYATSATTLADSGFNYSGTSTTPTFSATTSDGADNASVRLCGGGATGQTRGGYIILYGNENAGAGGISIIAGTGASVDVTQSKFFVKNTAVTSVADRTFHAEEDNASNNTVTIVGKFSHTTSGTPGAGIGTGIEFETETSNGNYEIGATIEAVTTDVTGASEDFDMVFKTMVAGAAASEHFRIGSNKIGFFGATTVVKQAGLTAITHTAPGTPDYAIQNLTAVGGYGFVTADEGNTVLSVIKAMHDAMKNYGLLT